MKQIRKETKSEVTEERHTKKVKKEELKVRDYVDTSRELTGLVKDNYLSGLQICLSLWEENLNTMNKQIDQWMSVQERYSTITRELFGKFPTESAKLWSDNFKTISGHIDKVLTLQKDYPSVIIKTSHKFTKDASELMKNALDKAFTIFNTTLNLSKG
jgi:hypothetical protein